MYSAAARRSASSSADRESWRTTPRRAISFGVRLARRVELIERVEDEKLDAGHRVDLLRATHAARPPPSRRRCACRDSGTGFRADRRLRRAARSRSPRYRRRCCRGACCDACSSPLRISRQRRSDVPAQANRSDAQGLVGKPADLAQRQDAGIEAAEHRPSALCAEIDCEEVIAHLAQDTCR